MGLISFFQKKEDEKVQLATPLNEDSDYMRELASKSHEAKRITAEKRKIERERAKIMEQIELEKARAQLEDLKSELYGEDEPEDDSMNPNDMFQMFMMNLMAKQNGIQMPTQPNIQEQNPPTAPAGVPNFSDEQMVQGINKLFNKDQIQALRGMSEADVLQAHRIIKNSP